MFRIFGRSAVLANSAAIFLVCLAVQSLAWGADVPGGSRAQILLTQKCLECHHGEDAKGKLDLATREALIAGGESGPAIVAGMPEKSLLWQRVEQDEMPPKHPLSADEKRVLRDWIADGAVWAGGALDPLAMTSEHRAGLDWWSLQPLKQVRVPASKTPGARQPIDDFIAGKLETKMLPMSPEADRRVIVRRISYDLVGLPPSPEDVDQFVQDERPDAFERLVDRLLASPHYGERWARHWLDVVRYGESNGFERDLPRPNAWPYRDWVIAALNRDVPYDEFVRWQLAGDLLAPDDVEAAKAVGFVVAGPHDTVVPVVDRMRAMMRQDELEDIVGTVSQTFLGLTVNCARCHDHKFDPITTREYYQLASALSGVDHGERDFVPSSVTRQLAGWQARIEELDKALRDQESPIRESILAERSNSPSPPATAGRIPNPMAAWDFTRDLHDMIGDMHVKLVGSARRTAEGLVVDGTSFGSTSRLPHDLREKTLEVRVRLGTLQQSGGGAISVQTMDGNVFDAIVYAEQEPARWIAGSNGFQRTASYRATAEEQADKEVVVFTQVYRADGTIVGYRNGRPYGQPIRKDALITYEAGKTHVVFGLRHGTEAGGNRMLQGTITAGRIYDKALSADEVAVSADASNTFITEAEIAAKLSPSDRTIRSHRLTELKDLRHSHSDLSKTAPFKLYTAIATQPPPMKVHKRGSVSSLGDEVSAAGLAAVQGLESGFGLRPDAIESHRRIQLANWITDVRNPLFARVMANRVWHYHFGSGLVESPNDLGFHAGTPSHPELLDWLAANFSAADRRSAVAGLDGQSRNSGSVTGTNSPMASGQTTFSMKRLHRLLVTSATYRQSSDFNPNAAKVDATNRLVWRINPRRLEAEEVRDSMLLIAGQLNSQLGGKGYSDVNSYFFKGTQFYDPIDPSGHANHRRTLYRMWARGGRSPFLDTFDCPDPSTTTPRRSATVTPLQALSLLNNSFSLRMADQLADRLTKETDGSPLAEIVRAYRLLFGREPDAEELRLGSELISRRGLPTFCRAMWNASEFLFID